jgi:hypothetical protein
MDIFASRFKFIFGSRFKFIFGSRFKFIFDDFTQFKFCFFNSIKLAKPLYDLSIFSFLSIFYTRIIYPKA